MEPEDPSVRKILSELSESLLGLNDYLTSSIPKSLPNVQIKFCGGKKKTIHWLEDLQAEHQGQVINLLELHLIATTAELEEVLQEIDKTKISQSKKDSKKLSIIKSQVNIRKRVLGQQIKIRYTLTRRKHLISDIIADFPLPDLVCNPLLFVEKEVDHKFQVNGTVEPF